MKNSIILLAFLLAYHNLLAQAGNLDSTFNHFGTASLAIGDSYSTANAILEQADKKILIAGNATQNKKEDFALIRYKANGSLDTAFGINGSVMNSIGDTSSYCTSMALQSDNKILLAGYCYDSSMTISRFAVMRYNQDGILDSSFGNRGKVITSVGSYGYGSSIAIQPDGKILIGGEAVVNDSGGFAIVRYNNDGTLDSSFGHFGESTLYIQDGPLAVLGSGILSIAQQADGKIVAAGWAGVGTSMGSYQAVAIERFDSSGAFDPTFDAVLESFGVNDVIEEGVCVKIQPDQKILLGIYNYAGAVNVPLARFSSNGLSDPSFGNNGVVVSDRKVGNAFLCNSIVLQPNGEILICGSGFGGGFFSQRYKSNGIIDSTFGLNGTVNTIIDTIPSIANSITLQSDGKILVTGYVINNSLQQIGVARYLNDLELGIISFNTNNNSILIYPIPIHQTATLKYTLSTDESISIYLFDINGKSVKTLLANQNQTKGNYTDRLNFDSNISPGNYLLVISSGKEKETVKIIKQ